MATTDRSYKTSHPWLTFRLDAGRFSPQFWLLLGEAKSKCEHISNAPMFPEVRDKLHTMALTKGIRGTTAIEGNSLTEEQVRQAIEGELELPRSKEYLRQEIDNIVEAWNGMLDTVVNGGDTKLSTERICAMNAQILKDLPLSDTTVVPGEIRTYGVGVLRYKAAPAQDCHHLLKRYCDWLNEDWTPEGEIWPDNCRLHFTIVKAVMAHLYFTWIHPFGDGNGRTARLIEAQILLSAGAPSAVCHLLSDYYNETRSLYYNHLHHASAAWGRDGELAIRPFLEYALRGLVEKEVEQIRELERQQQIIIWRDYVHRAFSTMTPSEAQKRRRQLAILVGVKQLNAQVKQAPLKRRELFELMPAAYRQKSDRTISRDINELIKMELFKEVQVGYLARTEALQGLVSKRYDPETEN